MNDTRYHRHFYSTPLYAPLDGAPRMFAVKPLHVGSRLRGRGHFGSARANLATKRRACESANAGVGRDTLEPQN
jgi:hypothetical protein